MLKIAICEDDIEYLELLYKYISELLNEEKISGKVVCKTGNPSVLEKYIESDDVNVFFLDIELRDETDGYTIAKKIRGKIKRPYIIFVTEHLEFLLQAFKTHAFDFLPKPVTKNIIKRCLLDVYNDYISTTDHSRTSKTLTIKSGSNTYYIKNEDIVYIEKISNKSIIHTKDRDISCYLSLEAFENDFLIDTSFVRCHKSYIANRKFIQEIRSVEAQIVFRTGQMCDIGRKYKKEVLKNGF